jgi:hypothetical protein
MGIENQAEFGEGGAVIWNWIRIRIRKSMMKKWVEHVVRKGGNIKTQRFLDFKTERKENIWET